MTDKDGWTLAHLAAVKDSKDCLEVLLQHCDLDLTLKDKWSRTVTEAASKTCKEYLDGIGIKTLLKSQIFCYNKIAVQSSVLLYHRVFTMLVVELCMKIHCIMI